MSNAPRGDSRVVAALRKAGIPVSSVWDLVNTREKYLDAIPILLRFVGEDMDARAKEGIVRALSVKEARGLASAALVSEYEKVSDPDSSLKWAIGNALSVVCDDSVFDDVVRLALDSRHGRGRQMLVEALARMKDPRAVDIAIQLLADEEVAGHALVVLRKLAPKKARPYIEPFLDHPSAWIRKEAQRALAKIDRGGLAN